VPHAFTGSKGVVRLERCGGAIGNSAAAAASEPAFSFEFRKLRFMWDPAAHAFCRLEYPAKRTFGEYRAAAGHGRPEAVAAARARWGANRFEVPVPRFAALMAEQLQAPFFCFQVLVLSSRFLLSCFLLLFSLSSPPLTHPSSAPRSSASRSGRSTSTGTTRYLPYSC
jgi:cation-transporting ATPase 13A1